MKNLSSRTLSAGFCLAFLLTVGCQPTGAADSSGEKGNEVALDSDIKQASYLLGYQGAERLVEQAQGVIDMEAFLQGTTDFVGQDASQVSGSEQARLMQVLQVAVQAKVTEANQGIRADGDKFREDYAAREGVTALPSGLLYEIITEGTGPKPTASDTVTTHYHGTLIDGTIFDSSVDRGAPASFPVGGVIAGWTEALQLMGVGSKWKLVIPPELAYGERGAGANIGPGATLVFEVELLSID